jgi:hypothetical protein
MADGFRGIHAHFCGPTFCSGMVTEFRSKKIPRNRLGTASFIPRKVGLRKSLFRSLERKEMALKISFTKNLALANRIDSLFSSETCFGTEFRAVVSSA